MKNKSIMLPFVTWNKISLPICLLLTHELLQNEKPTSHHHTEPTQCIICNCHNPLQTKNHKPATYTSVFTIQSPRSLYSIQSYWLARLHIPHLRYLKQKIFFFFYYNSCELLMWWSENPDNIDEKRLSFTYNVSSHPSSKQEPL